MTRPSPVVFCSRKIMCPDCSPPSTKPPSRILSRTYLSPTEVVSTAIPSRSIALRNPRLHMTVVTTVLFLRTPLSRMSIAQIASI